MSHFNHCLTIYKGRMQTADHALFVPQISRSARYPGGSTCWSIGESQRSKCKYSTSRNKTWNAGEYSRVTVGIYVIHSSLNKRDSNFSSISLSDKRNDYQLRDRDRGRETGGHIIYGNEIISIQPTKLSSSFSHSSHALHNHPAVLVNAVTTDSSLTSHSYFYFYHPCMAARKTRGRRH